MKDLSEDVIKTLWNLKASLVQEESIPEDCHYGSKLHFILPVKNTRVGWKMPGLVEPTPLFADRCNSEAGFGLMAASCFLVVRLQSLSDRAMDGRPRRCFSFEEVHLRMMMVVLFPGNRHSRLVIALYQPLDLPSWLPSCNRPMTGGVRVFGALRISERMRDFEEVFFHSPSQSHSVVHLSISNPPEFTRYLNCEFDRL